MEYSLELERLTTDATCAPLINTTNLTPNGLNEFESPYTLKQLKDLQIFIEFFEWFQTVEYLLCFLANILTVTAVIKYENLHNKPANILILALACADGVLGKLSVLLVFFLLHLTYNYLEETILIVNMTCLDINVYEVFRGRT